MKQWVEGTDYELVPCDDNNEQSWHVRILEGDYLETVVSFGAISVQGEELHFNFDIISSPDAELTVENEELQDTVAELLEGILEVAATDGSLATREK